MMFKKIMKLCSSIFFLCFFAIFVQNKICLGAENQLMNIPSKPQTPLIFQPGAVLRLPDGRRAIINQRLPNGDFQTNLGLVVSPEGVIRSDPGAGNAVVIEAPNLSQSIALQNEQYGSAPSQNLPDQGQTGASEQPAIITEIPDNAPGTILEQQKSEIVQPDQTLQTQKEGQSGQAAISQILPSSPANQQDNPENQPDNSQMPEQQTPEQLTLAQLLPLTKTTPQKQEEKTDLPPKKIESPNKESQKSAAENKAPEKAKSEKKVQEKKPSPPRKETQKTKVGEELRIPPESIKSGNLDFLEGCWQGTRPEYYSKRTIKECFCFGANGQNGKRRVIDPQGHRMCIGATRATLSGNGVLSVTSQGAACDDGERWGSAEMICKNSGQNTPCSWVFRDANNGRQSYTIPFIRVDTCGR